MSCTKWNFDIDHYLNSYLPSSTYLLSHFPQPLRHFLGYRDPKAPSKDLPMPILWLWAFTGAFCGISVVEAIFALPYFKSRGWPGIVSSYGAAAVLLFNTIDSPLAQPRNAFFGQIFSATIGVGITKLLQMSPHFDECLVWLAGALACGLASSVMSMTKTTHPPAGATALLAAVEPNVRRLGWNLVPAVCLGSVLMITVALVIDNIQRVYPTHWWTAEKVGDFGCKDVEKESAEQDRGDSAFEGAVVIGRDGIVVPSGLRLESSESEVLEKIRYRIACEGGTK